MGWVIEGFRLSRRVMRVSRIIVDGRISRKACRREGASENSGSKTSAQRFFQEREAVGIEPHRRLQHRCLHRARGWPVVEAGIVGNAALRRSSAPALEHGADELQVGSGG